MKKIVSGKQGIEPSLFTDSTACYLGLDPLSKTDAGHTCADLLSLYRPSEEAAYKRVNAHAEAFKKGLHYVSRPQALGDIDAISTAINTAKNIEALISFCTHSLYRNEATSLRIHTPQWRNLSPKK